MRLPLQEGVRRHLLAFLISLAGAAFVLTSVTVMNKFTQGKDDKESTTAVNFSVPQTTPKPAQAVPPPQKPPSPKNNTRSLAPLPSIGGGLSSLVLEGPDYAGGDLGGLSEGLLGDLDAVAMTAETVDKPPVVKASPLSYPERAKQQGIEGRVVVSVLIGADGRIKTLKILESSPPGVFDEAVNTSLPQWLFTPAEYQGRAVQLWATLPLDFTLN